MVRFRPKAPHSTQHAKRTVLSVVRGTLRENRIHGGSRERAKIVGDTNQRKLVATATLVAWPQDTAPKHAKRTVLSVVIKYRVKTKPKAPQAGVAQLAEQLICNQQVVGSSPITGSNQKKRNKNGQIPEWPNGSDCKSDVFDFGGSNPPLPTKTRLLCKK